MLAPSRAIRESISPSGVYLRKNARRKYDAILKSACRLFLKHGYTHTSMDAIAAAAGVSKQTVYSYFTNKDVLFCQMVEAECERHNPPEGMLENPGLKPEDALFRIGLGYMDIIIGPRGLAILRLVMAEAERHPRIAKLFFDSGPLKMQKLLSAYLLRQREAGIFDFENAEAATEHFFALVKGRWQMRAMLRLKPYPTKSELTAHICTVTKIFFKIYGKPA